MGGPVKNTRQEVERELHAVLHRHAEDAMKDTDTMVEHQKFKWVVADQTRTDHRRRWVLGGVAAAVAAVAIGIVVSFSDPAEAPSSPPVAQAPDQSRTADLSGAEGFAATFVAHDADAAASYLAPGTDEPWPDWRAEWKRNAAYGIEYLMQPCTETVSTSDATIFNCPYALHFLGSREVGNGPFRDNLLQVTVTDGKVTRADSTIPFETNGVQQHLESVDAWILENHPKNAPFLRQEEQQVRPVEWPRWTRLWQQYTQEYVAATNQAR
jgi:hypothetical protein